MPTLVAPLFVYGTLRDPDLLAPVLGRALNPLRCCLPSRPASAR